MKLNYTVNFDKKDEKESDSIKNKTKLSMQSLVGSVLASKQPSEPGQPMPQQNGAGGWGKAN